MQMRVQLPGSEPGKRMAADFDRATTTLELEVESWDDSRMTIRLQDRDDVAALSDFLDTVLCHWPEADPVEAD